MSQLLDLGVENPPLESVPFHGTGRIEQLLNTFSGWWILRLVIVKSALIAQGLPSSSVSSLQTLIDYLIEMTPAEGRAKMQNPIFASWLTRLWNRVMESQRNGNEKLPEWLLQHFDELQIIFLNELSGLRPFGGPSNPLRISSSQILNPLNV